MSTYCSYMVLKHANRESNFNKFCELTKKHSTNPSNAIYNLRILLWLQFGELIEVTPEILVTFSKKISRERHLELLRSTNMYRMLYILKKYAKKSWKILSKPFNNSTKIKFDSLLACFNTIYEQYVDILQDNFDRKKKYI